jgi:hypothetical protein
MCRVCPWPLLRECPRPLFIEYKTYVQRVPADSAERVLAASVLNECPHPLMEAFLLQLLRECQWPLLRECPRPLFIEYKTYVQRVPADSAERVLAASVLKECPRPLMEAFLLQLLRECPRPLLRECSRPLLIKYKTYVD